MELATQNAKQLDSSRKTNWHIVDLGGSSFLVEARFPFCSQKGHQKDTPKGANFPAGSEFGLRVRSPSSQEKTKGRQLPEKNVPDYKNTPPYEPLPIDFGASDSQVFRRQNRNLGCPVQGLGLPVEAEARSVWVERHTWSLHDPLKMGSLPKILGHRPIFKGSLGRLQAPQFTGNL